MRTCAVLTLAALALPQIARADDKSDKPGVFASLLPRVALGLAVEEMPNDGPHGGLIVRHVTPDGPAAKGGLKPGDIILRVSNIQVDDYEDLLGAVAGNKPGDELTFSTIRNREPIQVKVTLGAAAKDAKGAAAPEGCKSCAYLGVLAVPATSLIDESANRLGLSDDDGLVVIDVIPGSPAAAAGLRHGDVIRTIDGAEVRDPDALRAHVKQAGTGKEVALKVKRGDRTREVKATLAEGPCDIMLYTPKAEGRGDGQTKQVEQLMRRIDQLERRIRELEGNRDRKPEK